MEHDNEFEQRDRDAGKGSVAKSKRWMESNVRFRGWTLGGSPGGGWEFHAVGGTACSDDEWQVKVCAIGLCFRMSARKPADRKEKTKRPVGLTFTWNVRQRFRFLLN